MFFIFETDRADRPDFYHDFGYSFPLFSSLLKKSEEEKENELAKIMIMPFCLIFETLIH